MKEKSDLSHWVFKREKKISVQLHTGTKKKIPANG